MITLKNTQLVIKINKPVYQATAARALELLGYGDFDLGIWLTTNKTIQKYNKTYRAQDKPTDVLSFPFYPELKPGERITATDEDEKNLGDLIIAPEYVMNDCAQWGHTFDRRMNVLLVHGIYHLLGYDHEVDEDYLIMKKEEEWLLAQLDTQ